MRVLSVEELELVAGGTETKDGTPITDLPGYTVTPDPDPGSSGGGTLPGTGGGGNGGGGGANGFDPNHWNDNGYAGAIGKAPTFDLGWIQQHENRQNSLSAHVDATGTGGVVVAHGVDLGKMNANDLYALHLPKALYDKLSPYVDKTRANATSYLSAHPLSLSASEGATVDQAMATHISWLVATNYGTDAPEHLPTSRPSSFASLPENTQTAIMDVAYQYGPNLSNVAPKFWTAVTNGNWQDAYNELMNFGDSYSGRRHDDAALMLQDINSGALHH